VAARAALKAHIARMFTLAGFDDAEGRAGRVYALEERIAAGIAAARTAARRRTRTTLPPRRLREARAGAGLGRVPGRGGFEGQDLFIVGPPESIAASRRRARRAAADGRTTWRFRAIRTSAPCGPAAFRAEDFASTKRPCAARRRCPSLEDRGGADRPALGRQWAQIYWRGTSRRLAGHGHRDDPDLKASMGRRIQGLTWMTPRPRPGVGKLQNLRVEVGADARRRRHSAGGEAGEAFENLLRAQDFSRARIPGAAGAAEWTAANGR